MRIRGGIVRRDILVARVRDDRFEIVPEGVVLERGFEFVHHLDEFGVHLRFDLVHFGELHRVEERRFDVLRAQRDVHVLHEVRDGRISEDGDPLSRLLRDGDGSVHQFLDARAFERRDLDDGKPDLLFQQFCVDDVARLFHRVHHVERDDERNVDLHELRGKVEIAFEVGRVYNVDDARGLFFENEVPRDDLFGRVGRQRIDAGQIDDLHGFRALLVGADLFIDGDPGPVPDVRRRPRKEIEERGFPAVGVPRQGKLLHFFFTSMVTHAASVLRSVSS